MSRNILLLSAAALSLTSCAPKESELPKNFYEEIYNGGFSDLIDGNENIEFLCKINYGGYEYSYFLYDYTNPSSLHGRQRLIELKGDNYNGNYLISFDKIECISDTSSVKFIGKDVTSEYKLGPHGLPSPIIVDGFVSIRGQ